jgi:hypothetical protein
MMIPRENREYSPGERDLDVWLWLTGLSDGSFEFVSNSVGVTLSACSIFTHPLKLHVPSMSTISAQLRNFKEHGDEQPLLFFVITPSHAESHAVSQNNTEDDLHKMEILC